MAGIICSEGLAEVVAARLTESEVSLRGSVCRHRYLHRLLCSVGAALSPGNDGVSARRNALDFERAVFTADGEEWMFSSRRHKLSSTDADCI